MNIANPIQMNADRNQSHPVILPSGLDWSLLNGLFMEQVHKFFMRTVRGNLWK